MMKRAGKWLLVALIAAGFGFTGLLRSTAVIAQAVFYPAAAFTLLSVLLWFFEDGQVPVRVEPPQAKIVSLPNYRRTCPS